MKLKIKKIALASALVASALASAEANAADVVISSDTSGTQSFSSGTDSITINNGITLSTTDGTSAISGFPSSIANYGAISTSFYSLILNAGSGGTISSFINEGTVNSSGNNALNFDRGTITTLTNTGSMTAPQGFGINVDTMCSVSCPTIINLNNKQGGLTPLTYSGNLPTNYNIIIGSGATTTTGFGRVAFSNPSGTTTFGISSLSSTNIGVAGTRYQNVISGLTAGYITNEATTLTYTNGLLSATYQLVVDDASVTGTWDLLILTMINGPSATDTQSSLHTLASKLRGGFSGQTMATNFANMNTYDCDLFDAKGLCISAGGQQTYVNEPSSNFTSAVVTAGYKVSPTLRIGGFLNQNVNNSTGASVDISNGTPLMGLFAVWNKNEDHLGYQVKIANAYQQQDVRTIRDVVGTSEAGRGNTEINTQSYVGELSYAFTANEDKTLVRPYAALRYTRVKQDGYTEQTTAAVTAPLTYSALSDRSTTALVGVKLNHKLAEKVNLTGSLGIEQDLYHHVDNLTATGVSGLTSESFNDNIKRTRPVASIGATYTPAKNQRIAGTVFYQQLPFQSTGATTAYVNYTIGF